MSALEQLPLDSHNRRAHERLRLSDNVSVVFGRGDGVLVDLSVRGARIRHYAPVRRGASVRVSFEWERYRFSSTAEVLASRMISLGVGPSYESRVRFTSIDADSEAVLVTALEGIHGRDVRRWVANLRGWNDETPAALPRSTGSFIRCRLHGIWWERKCTKDTTQPDDGFLLPAESSEADIITLCDSYVAANEDERQLIRLMAGAAVEHSLGDR
jgi:PilZ domain